LKRIFKAITAKIVRFLTQTYAMSIYFGRTVLQLRHIYFYRKQIIDQCYTIGVGSFPLVCLVSVFSGMAVSIQMAYQMEVYVPDYMVGSIVVRSVVLELAPILMGLVLAGRVGAGIASEVGTMKVSEQVDALTSMAVDPVGYLMMPRFVAGLIMIPVLVAYSCALSIGAGFAMSVIKMDISVFNFIKGMKLDFMPYDVVVGMTKSVVYGGAITFVGSFVGLSAEGGAQGVGRAATAACVISSTLILILDYFLTHTMLT
jgi:phospholipid/cholesterol/gamma-HCH transport system permease protein